MADNIEEIVENIILSLADAMGVEQDDSDNSALDSEQQFGISENRTIQTFIELRSQSGFNNLNGFWAAITAGHDSEGLRNIKERYLKGDQNSFELTEDEKTHLKQDGILEDLTNQTSNPEQLIKLYALLRAFAPEINERYNQIAFPNNPSFLIRNIETTIENFYETKPGEKFALSLPKQYKLATAVQKLDAGTDQGFQSPLDRKDFRKIMPWKHIFKNSYSDEHITLNGIIESIESMYQLDTDETNELRTKLEKQATPFDIGNENKAFYLSGAHEEGNAWVRTAYVGNLMDNGLPTISAFLKDKGTIQASLEHMEAALILATLERTDPGAKLDAAKLVGPHISTKKGLKTAAWATMIHTVGGIAAALQLIPERNIVPQERETQAEAEQPKENTTVLKPEALNSNIDPITIMSAPSTQTTNSYAAQIVPDLRINDKQAKRPEYNTPILEQKTNDPDSNITTTQVTDATIQTSQVPSQNSAWLDINNPNNYNFSTVSYNSQTDDSDPLQTQGINEPLDTFDASFQMMSNNTSTTQDSNSTVGNITITRATAQPPPVDPKNNTKPIDDQASKEALLIKQVIGFVHDGYDGTSPLTPKILYEGLDKIAAQLALVTKDATTKATLEAGGPAAHAQILQYLKNIHDNPQYEAGKSSLDKAINLLGWNTDKTTLKAILSGFGLELPAFFFDNGLEAFKAGLEMVETVEKVAPYISTALKVDPNAPSADSDGATQSAGPAPSNLNAASAHMFKAILVKLGIIPGITTPIPAEDLTKIQNELLKQTREGNINAALWDALAQQTNVDGYDYSIVLRDYQQEYTASRKIADQTYEFTKDDGIKAFVDGFLGSIQQPQNLQEVNAPPAEIGPSGAPDYEETNRIAQAGLEALAQLCQKYGLGNKTLDDLAARGNGIDGKAYTDFAFVQQQMMILLRSPGILNKPYDPDQDGEYEDWVFDETTAQFLDENWIDIVTALKNNVKVSQADLDALQKVTYKDRYGVDKTFNLLLFPRPFVTAMEQLRDPDQYFPEDPYYLGNIAGYQGRKYKILPDKQPGIENDLKRIPLSYVQQEMLAHIETNITGANLSVIDTLCFGYTGRNLNEFQPSIVVPKSLNNLDDGAGFFDQMKAEIGSLLQAHNPNGTDTERKAYENAKLEILRGLDAVTLMPYGTAEQRDKYTKGVEGAFEAMEKALAAGQSKDEAAHAFAYSLNTIIGTTDMQIGFNAQPKILKTENGNEHPRNPFLDDLTINHTLQPTDAYISYMDRGNYNDPLYYSDGGTLFIAGQDDKGFFHIHKMPKSAVDAVGKFKSANPGDIVTNVNDLKPHMPAADFDEFSNAFAVAKHYNSHLSINAFINKIDGDLPPPLKIMRTNVLSAQAEAQRVQIAGLAASQEVNRIDKAFKTAEAQRLVTDRTTQEYTTRLQKHNADFEKQFAQTLNTNATTDKKLARAIKKAGGTGPYIAQQKQDPDSEYLKDLAAYIASKKTQDDAAVQSAINGYKTSSTFNDALDLALIAYKKTPTYQTQMNTVYDAFDGTYKDHPYGILPPPPIFLSENISPMALTIDVKYNIDDIAHASGNAGGEPIIYKNNGVTQAFVRDKSGIATVIEFTDAEIQTLLNEETAAQIAINKTREDLDKDITALQNTIKTQTDEERAKEKAWRAAVKERDQAFEDGDPDAIKAAQKKHNKALTEHNNAKAALQKSREKLNGGNDTNGLRQKRDALNNANISPVYANLLKDNPKLRMLYNSFPPGPRPNAKALIDELYHAQAFRAADKNAAPKVGIRNPGHTTGSAYSQIQNTKAKQNAYSSLKRSPGESMLAYKKRVEQAHLYTYQAGFGPRLETTRNGRVTVRYYVPEAEKQDVVNDLNAQINQTTRLNPSLVALHNDFDAMRAASQDENLSPDARREYEESMARISDKIAIEEANTIIPETGKTIAATRDDIARVLNKHDGTYTVDVTNDMTFFADFEAENGRGPTPQEMIDFRDQIPGLSYIAQHFNRPSHEGSSTGNNPWEVYTSLTSRQQNGVTVSRYNQTGQYSVVFNEAADVSAGDIYDDYAFSSPAQKKAYLKGSGCKTNGQYYNRIAPHRRDRLKQEERIKNRQRRLKQRAAKTLLAIEDSDPNQTQKYLNKLGNIEQRLFALQEQREAHNAYAATQGQKDNKHISAYAKKQEYMKIAASMTGQGVDVSDIGNALKNSPSNRGT